MPASKTKALAVRKANGVPRLSDEDNSVYAKCVALSKSQAVPMEYIGKPDKIFSTVVYGHEFGLGPMTALCNIFSVNGKCAMNVHLMLGLCMRHPDFGGYEIKTHTDKLCTILMYRMNTVSNKVFVYEGSWSIEEAVQAGLMGSGMYKKYPKNMLFARSLTFAMRKAFPDILTGTYSVEEMNPDEYDEEDMEAVEAIISDEAVSGEGKPAKTATPKRTPIGKAPPKKTKPVTATVKPNKIAPNR
jgi:hypothetical protein